MGNRHTHTPQLTTTMAFFGLTFCGPENVFKENLLDVLNLKSFSEAEIQAAFKRIDSDDSGLIDKKELRALLRELYNGQDPPQDEVHKLMTRFDADNSGTISWDEFRAGVLQIREELDDPKAQSATFVSQKEMLDSRSKHNRGGAAPAQVFKKPLTASQEVGWFEPSVATSAPNSRNGATSRWDAKTATRRIPPTERHSNPKSDITRFGEAA